MKKLIIIGGYGNGTVVANIVEEINQVQSEWEILGYFNDYEKNKINDYPIIGDISKESVKEYILDENVYFFYALISVKNNHNFLWKLESLEIPIHRFATLIHPNVVVSKNSKIGYNVCVQAFSIIGPNASIGNFVQVFGHATVGHNCKVENYCYITSNSIVGAHVIMHEGAFLGVNSTTLDRISIGKWSIVGQHSNVIRDIPDYSKAVGNPAKVIGSTK